MTDKIIRKRDPARKDIRYSTFQKIKKYLEQQREPVKKSSIMRALNVDYNSIDFAVQEIKGAKIDSKGMVYIENE